MEQLRGEKRNEVSLHQLNFGESTPTPIEMPKITEKMIEDFRTFFSEKSYSELRPVAITSGIDKTVRFIGSHISPMKEHFLNDKIPENGAIMSQPCVRTRNQPKLFDDSYIPQWGSYFKSLGALVRPGKIEELCDQSIEYLLKIANIPAANLVLRVNRNDSDLYKLALKYKDRGIQIDDTTMPEKYYRHKLGVDGVWGRNFNYAILNNGTLYDIGNLIILEQSDKQLGVELALGTSTILKHFFKLSHVSSSNPVFGIEKIDSPLRHKFEDTIITSAVLMSEGLRPSGTGNMERILRSYMRAMIYFKNKFELPTDAVVYMMKDFEGSQNLGHQGSEFLSQYIPQIESTLRNQKQLSPEEQAVLASLRS
jgi:hypothetical protein